MIFLVPQWRMVVWPFPFTSESVHTQFNSLTGQVGLQLGGRCEIPEIEPTNRIGCIEEFSDAVETDSQFVEFFFGFDEVNE